MSISPFLRSPFTDLTGGLYDHGLLGRCQKEELAFMDCLEAYGLGAGMKKCRLLHDDYRECYTLSKQFKRFMAMRIERDKQIASGKLTGDKRYVSPNADAY